MLSWEILYPIGTVILAGGLAYGMWKYHTRNKANDPITEQATREQYEHPKSYDEDKFKGRVKPD